MKVRDIESLNFTRDGAVLLAACDPARVASWGWPTLEAGPDWRNSTSSLLRGGSGMKCLSAGRDWVVAGSQDSTTKLLRLGKGGKLSLAKQWVSPQPKRTDLEPSAIQRLAGTLNPVKGSNAVLCVALNRDETLAASGTQLGAVQVASIPSGVAFGEVLRGHQDSVTSLAFSPNGDYLATSSRDRTVRLWRRTVSGFREVIALPASGPVVKVEFTADGEQLGVLVEKEHAVRVWDLKKLRGSLNKLGLNW